MNHWLESAKRHLDHVAEDLAKLEAENQRLKLPIEPFRECKCPSIFNKSYNPEYGEAEARRDYESAKETCQENDAAAAHNERVILHLIASCKAAGLRESESYYKSSRARSQTTKTKGWVLELRAAMPQSKWGTKALDARWDSLKVGFDTKKKDREQESRRRQAEREASERERRQTIAIADAARSLGIDPLSSRDDVLDALFAKDKYLRLAYAMEQTRGDWSDGFYRVWDAMATFDVENDADAKIIECLNSYRGEEFDGRCFRDCDWNYSKVYALADAELASLLTAINNAQQGA